MRSSHVLVPQQTFGPRCWTFPVREILREKCCSVDSIFVHRLTFFIVFPTPGFLQQFITPIVKVTKGSRSISFFSLPEYQQWLDGTGNGGKGWKIKYYKGLGTSTSAEAKEYFSSLDLHEVKFAQLSLDETTPAASEENDAVVPAKVCSGSDLIDMVFRKDRVSDRKDWLHTFTKETFLDYREVSEVGELKYSDFINKEYIIFSNYDNERSIPNIMDGFKPSQRKVLYACFKRKLKNEIKVAQVRTCVG
jgi:DNA topoisomerase II